jgi:hypothetical protein
MIEMIYYLGTLTVTGFFFGVGVWTPVLVYKVVHWSASRLPR